MGKKKVTGWLSPHNGRWLDEYTLKTGLKISQALDELVNLARQGTLLSDGVQPPAVVEQDRRLRILEQLLVRTAVESATNTRLTVQVLADLQGTEEARELYRHSQGAAVESVRKMTEQ